MPNVGPLREWQLLKAAVLQQCREAEAEIEEELLQLHWRAILIVLRCPRGHEATETGLAYAPVSQAHGHNHIVQCFACCTAA